MRKKFFAMYALVGALVASPVFTSCIDDTESASVTAVRTQKAEAMRIANQIAAANAELQIQRDKLALEKDIANYEQNIAYYEALLLSYQLQIKENQEALNNFGVKTLSDLTNAYTTALSDVATAEWNIVKYNQQIEALKGDFLGEQEYVVEETARLEAAISAKEAEIAKYKKLQEEGIDKESMQAEVEELRIASEIAEKELAELKNKYGVDTDGYLTETATGKAMKDLQTLTNTTNLKYYQNNAEGNPVLMEANVLQQQRNNAADLVDEQEALALAIAKLGKEDDKIDAKYETEVAGTKVKLSTAYAEMVIANEYLKTLEKTLAEKEKALAELPADATASDKQTAEGYVKDAKEDIEDFKTDDTNTTYSFTIGEGADAKSYVAKGLAYVEKYILECKDAIVTKEATLATAKEDSEEFEAAIAAFAGEDYEAYLGAVAELEAADDAYTLASGEYNALDNIYRNYNEGYIITDVRWNSDTQEWETYTKITISEFIKQLETEIEGYKAEIAELEAVVEYYENGYVDVDSEEMLAIVVAHIEKHIAIEETKLAAYNKMAEEAKAALDAYLAE